MTRQPKAKTPAPVLTVKITAEQHERAVQSNSGGCLIADAIKSQYPHLSKISVDMATIRATDQAKGIRYIWLTPPQGQHLLLSFDQGWPQPIEQVTTRRPVQVTKIARQQTGPNSISGVKERREAKRQELEEKVALGGTLSKGEKITLTQVSKPYEPTPRPTTSGPATVEVGSRTAAPIVVGGTRIRQGPTHPNLLRGRNRHFGAKLADPGVAFREAVEAAVAERVAKEGA